MTSKQANSIAFQAGIIGTVVMAVVMAIFRAVNVTALNSELIFGSFVTRATGAGSWLLGFLIHLAIGGLIGMLYGIGFRRFNRSGWLIGMSFGLIHWVVAGVLLGIGGMIHPLVPDEILDPGLYSAAMGSGGFFAYLIVHLIYGSIVGEVFKETAARVAVGPAVEEEERKRAA